MDGANRSVLWGFCNGLGWIRVNLFTLNQRVPSSSLGRPTPNLHGIVMQINSGAIVQAVASGINTPRDIAQPLIIDCAKALPSSRAQSEAQAAWSTNLPPFLSFRAEPRHRAGSSREIYAARWVIL